MSIVAGAPPRRPTRVEKALRAGADADDLRALAMTSGPRRGTSS
jgi:hypothetical protein